MNRDNAGSNLVFFLLGAAVGAAVALLYAPQEGEATRRLIGEKAGEVRDKASEVSGNVTQTAKEKWNAASDKVQEMLHRTQETAEDAVETVKEEVTPAVNSVS